MKRTSKSAAGTSFHGDTFKASPADLRKILGLPVSENNDGSDKTNFDWVLETEGGEVFTVYDWKYYRPIKEDEVIEWNLGGKSGKVTSEALNEIAGSLNDLG